MSSIDSGLPHQLRREPVTGGVFGPVQWAPVIAGAIAAAALAFVLHSVAIGMGLSAGSASPSWRDTSFALVHFLLIEPGACQPPSGRFCAS